MKELVNWIPPGMFTWCSRCGNIVHPGGKDFMCISCSRNFGGDRPVTPEILIQQKAEEELEKQRSDVVRDIRLVVAEQLSRWLPEKWWVKK